MTNASKDSGNTVSEDGLHYTARKAGSPFAKPGQSTFSTKTMSCFLCGRHVAVDEMKVRKLLGRNQRVCTVPCNRKP